MLRGIAFSVLLMPASAVSADVMLACGFPSLPDVVMQFPADAAAGKTMQVGARPAVPLTEGEGSGRLISATVDGYDFRFAPANSSMDVEREGSLVLSEIGQCITIGGPINDTPLTIAAPDQGSPAALAAPTEPAIAPPQSPPAGTGRWVVKEDKSAFDDTRTVVLTIESEDDIRSTFGAPGPAILYLRCMENTTVAYLWLNDLFLSDIQGFGDVDYRIDEQKAATARMSSSTDNTALGLWSGGKSIPFIKSLMTGKTVVLRATPFNESPVEFSFDLTGLETAISPLREACAW